jgi:hypothetical protein
VGAAPGPTLSDLEPFSVPPSTPCPALALFDPASQNRRLVFRSPPVLTKSECAAVSAHVDSFIASERGGVWGTVRKSSVKTTDVAVEDIPVLRPWLNELLLSRLYPLIAEAYPTLADGSSTLSPDGTSRVRVHDAFIVRYDADNDKSFHLPEHSDTSAVSFTVALNDHSEFEGGGTWFEALGGEGGEGMVVDCDVGEACAFAGPMRHAGYPITKGVRLILVLFLYGARARARAKRALWNGFRLLPPVVARPRPPLTPLPLFALASLPRCCQVRGGLQVRRVREIVHGRRLLRQLQQEREPRGSGREERGEAERG